MFPFLYLILIKREKSVPWRHRRHSVSRRQVPFPHGRERRMLGSASSNNSSMCYVTNPCLGSLRNSNSHATLLYRDNPYTTASKATIQTPIGKVSHIKRTRLLVRKIEKSPCFVDVARIVFILKRNQATLCHISFRSITANVRAEVEHPEGTGGLQKVPKTLYNALKGTTSVAILLKLESPPPLSNTT